MQQPGLSGLSGSSGSSTQIRKNIRENLDISDHVPKDVRDYINKNNLYKI